MKFTGNAVITLNLSKQIETRASNPEDGETKLDTLAGQELKKLLEHFDYGAAGFELDDSDAELQDFEEEE